MAKKAKMEAGEQERAGGWVGHPGGGVDGKTLKDDVKWGRCW